MQSDNNADSDGATVRGRIVALLYACGRTTTFTVSQLATILDVSEALVQQAAASSSSIAYSVRRQTIQLQRQHTGTHDKANDSDTNDDDAAVHAAYPTRRVLASRCKPSSTTTAALDATSTVAAATAAMPPSLVSEAAASASANGSAQQTADLMSRTGGNKTHTANASDSGMAAGGGDVTDVRHHHGWDDVAMYSSAGGLERRTVGAPLRRRGGARGKPYMRAAKALQEKRQVLPLGQVGRVGYVCVADEFDLAGLEAHYRYLSYFTKFDFDVLHIRFADAEMQIGSTTTPAVAEPLTGVATQARDVASGRSAGGGNGGGTANKDGSNSTWNYGATAYSGGNMGASTVAASVKTTTSSRLSASANDTPAVVATQSTTASTPTTAAGTGVCERGSHTLGDGLRGDEATGVVNDVRAVLPRGGFDLFIFEYGAVVWWGFDQRYFKIVENDFMLPDSAIGKYMVNRYTTRLVNENYPVWCTYTLIAKDRPEADEDFKRRLRFDHFLVPYGQGDVNTCSVSMLCASHALAQSAKIDYLEIKVQELTESCSPLPRDLKEHGGVTISERRLLQLRGEVLSYRLMLKSGSDLLDEPDLFWENAYLKPVFQATKEGFEISERVEALDNKLDAANEILSILADEFSQRHGARLEWIVIWLVFVEVIIGVLELLVDARPWFFSR